MPTTAHLAQLLEMVAARALAGHRITIGFNSVGALHVSDGRRTGVARRHAFDTHPGAALAEALAYYVNRRCEPDGTLAVWAPEQEAAQ